MVEPPMVFRPLFAQGVAGEASKTVGTPGTAGTGGGGQSYVVEGGVTVLLIGLAIFAVCRGSRRT
jgi:hypothetical protein